MTRPKKTTSDWAERRQLKDAGLLTGTRRGSIHGINKGSRACDWPAKHYAFLC